MSMAASVHLLLPSPSSQMRFLYSKHCRSDRVCLAVLRSHREHDYEFCARPHGASWKQGYSSARGLAKLACKPMRNCISVGVLGRKENLQSVVDTSSVCMDAMDDFEQQLQEFFVEVKQMLKMGNKDDATDLLRANYEAVKEQIDDGARDIEQAATLDVIALGYIGLGDFQFAEHLLEMLNEIMGSLTDDKPWMDLILVHMGSMFTSLGKLEEATFAYERALKILEYLFGKESPFLVTPLLGMAKIFRLSGKVPKAIEIYYRAVAILETSRGTDSEDLVLPLSTLGNFFIDECRAEDAKSLFSRILTIYSKLYGENDGRVGMAMCSLAHANCAEGNIEEAIHMYKMGLQVIKDSKYMALDDSVLERMIIDLAELLHFAGREREGREMLEECLLVTEKLKGREHPSSVTHLLNLATSYSHSKNFVEAERLVRLSLQIMSKIVGLKDQSITIPMLHLSVILYHLKRDKEAENIALDVLQIREAAFGTESLPVGEALDCLISIQTRLEKEDGEILAQLKRLLTIQEKELGYESEEAMITLKKVVFYLDKMGKRNEKLPLQRRLSVLTNKYKHRVPT